MVDRIEYILFVGFSKFFKLIGLYLTRRFASILALFFYYLIPIRKETVVENLKLAFPEYSQKKIKEISFKCYKSFAITLVEILYLPFMSNRKIETVLKCKNIDFVRKKCNEKNGVILLSAHFGNWEYMAVSMGYQLKTAIAVVVKSQRNVYVTKWLNQVRGKWGNRVVPIGISIRQIYSELKNKNVVAMVADQRGPKEGIRVNFFNKNTAVYSGPALLSLKTHAPILYGVAIRQPDYSYETEFIEISTENLPSENEAKITELSRRHMLQLEKFIRKYPEQWLWMHKRWKY